MTVEVVLEELSRRAAAYLQEATNAPDPETRDEFTNMRRVVLAEASYVIPRTPEGVKLIVGCRQHRLLGMTVSAMRNSAWVPGGYTVTRLAEA
jgi:hypothetical protein